MAAPLELRYTTLDVFTTTRYAGNPLAVVTVPAEQRASLTQDAKQRIAREFNYSETVFLHNPSEPQATNRAIDIFTPTTELPFAGHPTIGTACLLRLGEASPPVQTLVTKAGPIALSAGAVAGSAKAAIPHDVHVHGGRLATLAGARELVASGALGHGNDAILQAELDAPAVSIVKGMTFLLVRLASLELLGMVGLARGTVDLSAVEGLLDEGPWRKTRMGRYYYVLDEGTGDGVVGVRTRMVGLGIEDPATGSAACTLASYLTLQREEGGEAPVRYEITQGVEMRRKSEITVEVVPRRDRKGDSTIKEVYLSGSAVVVMTGTLVV